MPAIGPAPGASNSPVAYAQPDIESMADMMTRQHPGVQRVKSTIHKALTKGAAKGWSKASKMKLRAGRARGPRSGGRGKAG